MSNKKVMCAHCGEEPGLVKHCESTGEVYWALECDCKSTSYFRSAMFAVSEWEETTYKQDPKEALSIMKIHY